MKKVMPYIIGLMMLMPGCTCNDDNSVSCGAYKFTPDASAGNIAGWLLILLLALAIIALVIWIRDNL